eukprot:scaffold50_cov162-Ochromonas_danica.AAC.17
MNAATDEQENVNELKFGALNFDKVQSLTQDEMFFLLAQRQQSGLTNEYLPPLPSYPTHPQGGEQSRPHRAGEPHNGAGRVSDQLAAWPSVLSRLLT